MSYQIVTNVCEFMKSYQNRRRWWIDKLITRKKFWKHEFYNVSERKLYKTNLLKMRIGTCNFGNNYKKPSTCAKGGDNKLIKINIMFIL